jgi:hypothetical protein
MRFEKHMGLLALVGLGACGSAGESETDRDLDRLEALGVFEVRYLVVDQTGPRDCTSGTCSESQTGRAPASLNARVARRLARLADLAELAALSVRGDPSALDRVEVNLALLRSREIVGVGDFIRKQPSKNPLCNDMPCQSDIHAAQEENQARAAVLEAIAIAAQSL